MGELVLYYFLLCATMAMNCFLAAQCRINVCRTVLKMLKIHTYVFLLNTPPFYRRVKNIYIRALSALTLCALRNLHATLSHNKIYVIFVWTVYKTYSISVSHAARVVLGRKKAKLWANSICVPPVVLLQFILSVHVHI